MQIHFFNESLSWTNLRSSKALRAALEESDMPKIFLLALRNVVEACGISQLAKNSQLNRENLYKILSRTGNPELNSLYAILDALGFKLSVELKETS